MAKKKLNLTYIADETLRKRSFKHRKNGLMKKLNDLKILCGIDACAIIYHPFNSNPEVWPSNSGVNNVIQKFEMLTEKQKISKSVNHEEFLNQYIATVEKQKNKLIENNENFLRKIMFKCLGGNMKDSDLNDNDRVELCKFIDQYIRNLYNHRNITLNNPNFEFGESSSMVVAANMTPTAMAANMAPTTVVANIAPTYVSAFMEPTTMGEMSSSSFSNAPFFNSPQLTNELQCVVSPNQGLEHANSLGSNLFSSSDQNFYISAMNQSMISSNQGSEQIDILASNILPIGNQEVYFPVMEESIIPSNQRSERFNFLTSNLFPTSNQEICLTNMNQDGFYNLNQNQNESQQQGFVEEMMNYAEQTSFPWIEDYHHFNNN